ncbi:hypothetical protein, partial [Nitrosomonas sp.]|uniref:hypothetical protein n=1 Tax=Nitrosomonas sp. TaxID=42353 RepID=UPI0025DC2D18
WQKWDNSIAQREKQEKYLFLQFIVRLWKITMQPKIRKTGVYGWELTRLSGVIKLCQSYLS